MDLKLSKQVTLIVIKIEDYERANYEQPIQRGDAPGFTLDSEKAGAAALIINGYAITRDNRYRKPRTETGAPDYLITKDGGRTFEYAEIKTPNTGFSKKQLSWLANHPNDKLTLIYVE